MVERVADAPPRLRAAREDERPVRVLHVAEAFGGGLLEMIRIVSERLAGEGHPQAIAYGIRPETPADPRTAVREPVELYELGWDRSVPSTHLLARRRLQSLCREWRPDVVHLHSSFAGVFAARPLGNEIPTIFTPNALASQLMTSGALSRRAYALAERFAIRACDVLGAVSASEATAARALGARDIVTIPNGIPELDESQLLLSSLLEGRDRPSTERPRVVAGGRISPQRQPDACARILGRLHDVADVTWVGGGGDDGAYGDAARAELAANGVEVTGWVPREEAVEAVRGAAAYLHFAAWDGLPFSVLEAMAVDTVVIASDTGPNRELLDERQICRTEDEAVATLRRLLTDADYARSLAAGQRERRGRFSAEAMVEAWADIYHELASRKPQARRASAVPAVRVAV